MAKMFQVYGIGQALIPVLPPPIPFQNAPTSNQTNYEIGQLVYTPPHAPTAFYIYGGGGSWIEIATNSGAVLSVTGTANQILASPTTGNVVLSLIGPYTPATYTAHGVLIGEGTSSIVATAAGTAGQLLTSGGASADPTWTTATFPATVTAGSLLVGTASNVVGSLADVAVGQLLASGGVGVVPAYTASPSVSGSLTAATGVTATTGNVTASAGNLVAAGAGNGVSLPVTTASGAASGTVNCNGRVGSVTFTGVSIASNADLTLTLGNTSIAGASTRLLFSMSGATTGSALSVKSVTPGTGTYAWVVTNGDGLSIVTSVANITFDFIVLN